MMRQLVAALVLPITLFAVDGVVLFDQARALAGGVTPGDTPGFPVTISVSGSYRLSGNLTVPSGLSGIEVTVPKVTIDLNGFSIATPVQIQQSSGRGIYGNGAGSAKNITVRNGRIEGFTSGFQFYDNGLTCQYCTLEDLYLNWANPAGSASLDLGNFTRVRNVTAPTSDINVKCPSLVVETVARSINIAFTFPGDPIVNVGQCTFANNAKEF